MPTSTLPLAGFLLLLLAAPGAAGPRSSPRAAAPAAEDGRPSLQASRLRQDAIVLDGRLDDAAWAAAQAATGFRVWDPDRGALPSEETVLRIAYDDAALYVGARLFDTEPAAIARRLSRRDDAGGADSFTIYLDPHHDHLTGVMFVVTASGVQVDRVIFNDSWTDSSWDAVWDSAVSIDDAGWSVEMRIPLSQLRFSAAPQQVWGLNAARYLERRNETDFFELVPKNESGLASRMGHLTGLDGLEPRHNLEALPYAVARGDYVAPEDPGDPFNDGSRRFGGLGLDLKYGLSSSFSLAATLNPDFGQVEVDPAVVNLSDFETFFPERRPFFVEGAQLFENFGHNGANDFWGFNRSEPDLFYSRRIGRAPQASSDADFADAPGATTILGAAKVTGKTANGWSLGLIEALTAREDARTYRAGSFGSSEVEPPTNYLVLRAHRDLRRGGLGVLGTSVIRALDEPSVTDLLPRRAWVAGLDGYFFLDARKQWVLVGRLAASRLEGSASAIGELQRASQHYFQRPDAARIRLDPAATSLSGWTGSINLNRNAGELRLNAALWATSPGFESNDLGFNSRSDRWGAHVVGSWRKTEPDALTRQRSISLAKWYSLNFDGQRQGDGLHLFFNGQLRNYWSLGGNAWRRWRAWNDQLTRGGPNTINPSAYGGGAWLESDSRKPVGVGIEAWLNRNEYGGRGLESAVRVKLRPTTWLELSLGPSVERGRTVAQWVDRFDDLSAEATYGARYVFAQLDRTELNLTTRLNWTFSPEASLQLYAQPLLSAGDYGGFKELARPASYAFSVYGSEAGTIRLNAGGDAYTVDPDGDGPAPPFQFDQPDFNLKSLRLNAVFRWEWRPGSALYVVWTRNQSVTTSNGDFDLGRDLDGLFAASSDDLLLLKASYRFGR